WISRDRDQPPATRAGVDELRLEESKLLLAPNEGASANLPRTHGRRPPLYGRGVAASTQRAPASGCCGQPDDAAAAADDRAHDLLLRPRVCGDRRQGTAEGLGDHTDDRGRGELRILRRDGAGLDPLANQRRHSPAIAAPVRQALDVDRGIQRLVHQGPGETPVAEGAAGGRGPPRLEEARPARGAWPRGGAGRAPAARRPCGDDGVEARLTIA